MGRGDDLTINIPPAPFKGGDGMVSRTGEMGWSIGWGDVTVSRAGDVTVSRTGRFDG